MPEPSAFEFDMAIEKLKKYKLINRIPAEFIKSGSRTIRSEIHKLITSSWKKEELPEERKESIIVPIYKKDNKTDCSNYRGISLCQLCINFFQHPAVNVNTIYRGNYWGSSVWISTQEVNY